MYVNSCGVCVNHRPARDAIEGITSNPFTVHAYTISPAVRFHVAHTNTLSAKKSQKKGVQLCAHRFLKNHVCQLEMHGYHERLIQFHTVFTCVLNDMPNLIMPMVECGVRLAWLAGTVNIAPNQCEPKKFRRS